MTKWAMGAVAALILSSTGAGARAAQLEKVERPLALRVGALFPTDDTVINATNNSWFNVGLDYALSRTPEGNETLASIDLGTSHHANFWAFQGIYMWRNAEGYSGSHAFSFGLGGAIYVLKPMQGKSATRLGIPVVADWALNRDWFVEGKYHWIVTEASADALTLQLGYRF